MLYVGLEVAVAEQHRQVGLDTGGGDDPVDFLARSDALAVQRSVSLCRLPGVAAAWHGVQRQSDACEYSTSSMDVLISQDCH